MNIEEFRLYCLSKNGVTESIPFPKLPDVLVFKVLGKMFTVTSLKEFNGFSIKCVPDTIDELRASYPALSEPAYFSKKHWSYVLLDGSISNKLLLEWIDTSYDLVIANCSKKLRKNLL